MPAPRTLHTLAKMRHALGLLWLGLLADAAEQQQCSMAIISTRVAGVMHAWLS